jgi:hypothetical protein
MRQLRTILFVFVMTISVMLGSHFLHAQTSIPTREEFINAIYPTVVDKSFSQYYLSDQAYPCSFVKYDYSEWVKYALQESVTIDILDDLARSSYYDRKPASWQADKLSKAICIDEAKCDSMLDPTGELWRSHHGGDGSVRGDSVAGATSGGNASGGSGSGGNASSQLVKESQLSKESQKKIYKKEIKAWNRLPAAERTVFFFSRPLFTDDGRYAIIDLTYRCDGHLCGMGATCLFKQTAAGWKLIGRKVNWGG